MVVELPLPQGHVVLVDSADASLVEGHKWHAHPNGRTYYAQRRVLHPDGYWTSRYMHQLLTSWAYVDHVNGNGLDNRRANLRQTLHSQNCMNRRKRLGATSRFKGVSRRTRSSLWRAGIKVDGVQIWIGLYETEDEAAHIYDAAARWHFGEFAALNFPLAGERSALDDTPKETTR